MTSNDCLIHQPGYHKCACCKIVASEKMLRDEFASIVLAAITQEIWITDWDIEDAKKVAAIAYDYADAMMLERKGAEK